LNCYIHKNEKSIHICSNCNNSICDYCHISLDEKPICMRCFSKNEINSQSSQEERTIYHNSYQNKNIKKSNKYKKNIKSLSLIELFSIPIFPLGTNYLYMGHTKKAVIALVISAILFVQAIFHLFIRDTFLYTHIGFDTSIRSMLFFYVITFIHCLKIRNRTKKVKHLSRYLLISVIIAFVILRFVSRNYYIAHVIFGLSIPVIVLSFIVVAIITIFNLIKGSNTSHIRYTHDSYSYENGKENVYTRIEEESIITNNVATDTELENLNKLEKLYTQLKTKKIDFKNTELESKINNICDTTEKIYKFLKQEPSKQNKLVQFVEYYLPTTVKILDNYIYLKKQSSVGENIKTSMKKIEDLLVVLEKAFNSQLDMLFSDKTIDIDAEISVLTQMLENDGLTK